jgi:hypothetical protein
LAFRWVLPGHGEWVELDGDGSADTTAAALDQAVAWMREQPKGNVSLLRWIPFLMARTKPKSRLARFAATIGGSLRESWLIPRRARYLLPDHPARPPAVSRPLLIAATAALSAVAMVGLAML